MKNLIGLFFGRALGIATFFASLIFILFPYTTFADKIIIYTEDQPPLNFYLPDEDKMTGFATDIVKEILLRIDSDAQIKRLPWARAYFYMERGDKDNMFLYGMARTKIRENKFKWVGPIAMKKAFLFAKKSSNIKINNLEEAKSFKYIGTKRKDSKEQYLKNKGFTNTDPSVTWDQALKKLMIGRIELIIFTDLDLPILAKRVGANTDEIEVVLELYKYPVYIGVSKATSDKMVQKWQNALNSIKEDGTFEKKINEWSKFQIGNTRTEYFKSNKN